MTNEVTICNIALGYIGGDANLTSINPPDGHIESEHCNRFYPIARDALLELHTWSFAVKTEKATLLEVKPLDWMYAYACPSKMLNLCEVLSPKNHIGDLQFVTEPYELWALNLQSPVQDFVIETNSKGEEIILTNQKDAVLRYTVSVTDPTKFSSLFVQTLTRYLASMLAGPIIKGMEGIKVGEEQMKMAVNLLGEAKFQDSIQRNVNPKQRVPWIVGRY